MPFSSPTTTRAVKEKRRPPLTTFATRLISTTRSCRSMPAGLTERSMSVPILIRLPPSRETVAVRRARNGRRSRARSYGEASLAYALGEGADAAVVLVAAAVEDGPLDARGLGALREELAGL